MSFEELQEFWQIAVDRLDAFGGDLAKLSQPLQTVLIVEAAQGIIDNGGLEYFFEADFPGNPPYSVFAEAFERVGAVAAAAGIEAAARMFPFEEPQLHEAKRQAWIESVKSDRSHEFVVLSWKLCGDESVFIKLAEYVERNRSAFAA
ncbi:DMP19 family protein [Caenimonas aquaedulcis]|uniref:DUF4375 domain-containing protein n=1 Tax=Caenimonas aquaedulcis TaxID=2793270 RepID=A0A931H7G0_9BURK|nr:DUF4375 domain-containing protein [Caenimonas aquaedulcis]MBG9390084.1 DUF4375 domain-containing protein [Caenimonas aquaedulcis]